MARQIRLYYLFRLLATSYFFVPTFVFFKQERGLSWEQILFLGAIYSVTVILFEVPTGAFADRIGRRASMMVGSLAMVASCLVAYWSHSFASFAVAEVLAALSITMCSGADSAFLFDLLVSRGMADDYAKTEATATAMNNLGRAFAALAGGFLALIDLALPFLATAGTAGAAFFVSFLLKGRGVGWVTGLHRRIQGPGAEFMQYGRHMGRALTQVFTNPRLLWLVFYSALVFSLLVATEFVYQPYLDTRGFDLAAIGAVFAGIFFASALAAVCVVPVVNAIGTRGLAWGLLLVITGTFFMLTRFSGVAAILGILAIQAIARGFYSPVVKTLLNHEIADSQQRATILSVESIFRRLFSSGLTPAVGLMGAGAALYLCGGVGLFGLVVLGLSFRYGPRAASR